MTELSEHLWGTGSASPTYITRPAIANERLATDERGQVVHTFKQPFRDGSTHTVLDPRDFIARLAALVPRPRLNLTWFHGVFAPNFRHREHVVPQREPREEIDKPLAPMTPMQRLKRVFAIDPNAARSRPAPGAAVRCVSSRASRTPTSSPRFSSSSTSNRTCLQAGFGWFFFLCAMPLWAGSAGILFNGRFVILHDLP